MRGGVLVTAVSDVTPLVFWPPGSESMCNRTWDGWLCWEDTIAGYTSEQSCPDYFQDFDPSGEVLVRLDQRIADTVGNFTE